MFDVRHTAQKLVLSGAYWSGAAAIASRFLSGCGAILMLHRVNAGGTSPLNFNTHLTITPEFLDVMLRDIRRQGLAFVSMDEMVENLAKGRTGTVAVTLDDGWLDNLTDALPVFEAHNVPFTVYVTTGFVSGEVAPWWEVVEEFVAVGGQVDLPTVQAAGDSKSQIRALIRHLWREMPQTEQQAFLRRIGAIDDSKPRKFMNWDEVRLLSSHPLATIGAHTVHHYNLRRLDEEAALFEMAESARIIERETGRRPRHFAYPYGSPRAAGEREARLAKGAGFASAVTTRHGVLQHEHREHLHALPRISINGRYQRLPYVRTLLSGLSTAIANRGKTLVTL